ncbi:MAG TPA: hypothetical protein VHX36_17275 [Candidatus Acidoferrales bacterium]|jgi:hypothetical protein|nr:hypothetical protein [Candidatus Acidoferrales bacterium]
MKLLRRKSPLLLVLIALVALQPAFGLRYPLSSRDIREAYFLGKGSPEKRLAFLAKYRRDFPTPAAGPHVSTIEIVTPYSYVVNHAWRTFNYLAPDAEEEFLGKPALFRIRVRIDLTASYGAQIPSKDGGFRARPDDFGKDFKVRFTQKDEIHPQTSIAQPIYQAGDDGGSWLVGNTIRLEYDPTDVDASMPARVEVITPDGQDVQTTFDLAELR